MRELAGRVANGIDQHIVQQDVRADANVAGLTEFAEVLEYRGTSEHSFDGAPDATSQSRIDEHDGLRGTAHIDRKTAARRQVQRSVAQENLVAQFGKLRMQIRRCARRRRSNSAISARPAASRRHRRESRGSATSWRRSMRGPPPLFRVREE